MKYGKKIDTNKTVILVLYKILTILQTIIDIILESLYIIKQGRHLY